MEKLKLIKATAGSNGSPDKCGACGSIHFIKMGIAWYCTDCGVYFPTELTNTPATRSLLVNLHNIEKLRVKMGDRIKELEIIVKE